jgi:GNAT superfamily N-acetyltransferase
MAPVLVAHTLAEREELKPHFERLAEAGWPRFLRQRDELGLGQFWPSLFTTFSDYQFALSDESGEVVAVGHAIPFVWDGSAAGLPETMVEILSRATSDREAGRPPTALSALAALVDPDRRAQGLSAAVLRAMGRLARTYGLALVAPVRPTLKASYPLTPMERYAHWKHPDGAPFDPWFRVHWRLGAEFVRVVPRTLVIVGRVADWEEWTGMRFPDSGPYVVPGALQPVLIDRERDEGRYEDPNVWMRHPVGGDASR